MARRRYLVTYDIADDRRRTRVFKTLRGCGDHLQFSVFLCDLNERERIRLRSRLDEAIDHRQDQILTVDLGPSDSDPDQRISSLGRAYEHPGQALVV